LPKTNNRLGSHNNNTDTKVLQNLSQICDVVKDAIDSLKDYHYKFLVLLPLEADEKIEVLKHYFGITFDNELVMRGIEIRRHDVPPFIKRFQTRLLYTHYLTAKIPLK
jgi:hypothetical protein